MPETKPRKWYNRMEIWGGIAIFGKLLQLFPDHTLVDQAGETFVWSLGIAIYTGIAKGLEGNNLPSGLRKVAEPIVSIVNKTFNK